MWYNLEVAKQGRVKRLTDMEKEYLKIVKKIINNKNYKKLKNETHHNHYERYSHSIAVSYKTYKICKKLNLDYVSATRAAVLHDFFFDNQFLDKSKFYKLTTHYKKSLENASKITSLNEKEKNIISSHMFPIGGKLPRSLESVVVDFIDDVVSFREFFSYKYRLVKTIFDYLIISFIY